MSSSVLNLPEFPISFPAPQAQSSDTFHPPPVDGTRSLPELYEYNAKHSPDHPLFAFADDSGATRTIKYPEAWRMIQRAAKIAHGYVAKHQGHYSTQGSEIPMTPPTVGILANAGGQIFSSVCTAHHLTIFYCSILQIILVIYQRFWPQCVLE